MVRAELGNGNRDGAVALLERVRARYVNWVLCRMLCAHMISSEFPVAVYNRISGIMLDEAVSPWSSSEGSSYSS